MRVEAKGSNLTFERSIQGTIPVVLHVMQHGGRTFEVTNQSIIALKNGNCCKFCDAVDFTLNHGHFEELMFSTHELYFQSHFLNFVKVPNVISCDCDMEKASKCPNKFY